MLFDIFSIIISMLLLILMILFLRYSQDRTSRIGALAANSKIVKTKLGPIEYTISGDQSPVILFLHGTPGGCDQTPELDESYTILAPSRPGYLRTPLSVGATPELQAKAYIALLDQLNIESVIVAGASGGGPSAITFAAQYPDRTLGLIALEAVSMSEAIPKSPGFLSNDFLAWIMLSVFNLLSDQRLIKMMIPNAGNQERALEDPEKVKTIRGLIWSLWPPSMRDEGMQNDFQQFSQLSLPIEQVTVPTLIIHGDNDTNVDYSHAELLAQTIKDAQLHTIEGADHMMPFTHQEEVEAALLSFINRLVSS